MPLSPVDYVPSPVGVALAPASILVVRPPAGRQRFAAPTPQIILPPAQVAAGQVVFDAVGPSSAGAGQTGGASPFTWSHICSGTDRVLLIGVCLAWSTAGTPTTTATYAGQACTSLGKKFSANGTACYAELFALVNPPTGANTVSITITPGGATIEGIEAGSVSLTGATQTIGDITVVTAAGNTGTTASATIGSAAGRMVVGLFIDGGPLAGPNQTQRWVLNRNSTTAGGNGAMDTAAGAASVTVSRTQNNAESFAVIVADVPVATATGTNYTADLPDDAGLTDDLARQLDYARDLAELTGTADTLTAVLSAARTFTDDAAPTDAMVGSQGWIRAQPDDAAPTDALARVVAAARDLPDLTGGPTDTLAQAAGYIRSVADDTGTTDAISYVVQVIHNRSVDDDAGLIDTRPNSRTVAFVRDQPELTGTADTLDQAVGYARALTDDAAPTDAISYTLLVLITRSLDDGAGLTDTLAQAATYARLVADIGGPTDALAAAAGYARVVADDAKPTDAVSYVVLVTVTRSIDDVAGTTDTMTRTAGTTRVMADDAAAADTMALVAAYVRQMADDAAPTDTLTPVVVAGLDVAVGTGLVVAVVGSSSVLAGQPGSVVWVGPGSASSVAAGRPRSSVQPGPSSGEVR